MSIVDTIFFGGHVLPYVVTALFKRLRHRRADSYPFALEGTCGGEDMRISYLILFVLYLV